MSSWIMTVFVTTLMCTIYEFFVMENSFKQIIKSVLGVFFIINLVVPLKNIKIPKINLEFEQNNEKIQTDSENRINDIAKKKIREKIENFLSKNGIKIKNLVIHIDKNHSVRCGISFEEGAELKEKTIKKLKDEFKIDFYPID